MLSFLGTQLFDRSSHVETKVYVKPTNTGLLLLDHAFRLSSNWSYFSEECDRLKLLFFRLKYPDKLLSYALLPQKCLINLFHHPRLFLINLTLFVLFYHLKTSSNQSSADIVPRQLQDFSHKLHTTVSPKCLSAKRLNAILKCEKLSHLLSTSNVSCLQI